MPGPRLQHPVGDGDAQGTTVKSIYGRAHFCARSPVAQERSIYGVFDDYLGTRVPDATGKEITVHDNVTAPERRVCGS